MDIFNHLGLFFVGVTIAAIGILGFVIFYNNRKSQTHRAFLFFSIITIIWSVFNYLTSQIIKPDIFLWNVRVVMFLATWHAFLFFHLCFVFPSERVLFPRWYKFALLPITVITSFLALTPLLFTLKDISFNSTETVPGPGMLIFLPLVFFSIIGGLLSLLRKRKKAEGLVRKQFQYILLGSSLTFVLLLVFNFILPAFFLQRDFLPFGAMFLFPFIAFTGFAIVKYNLLNIKAITTELFVLILVILNLLQIILSESTSAMIIGLSTFVLVLIFGLSLIRGVLQEVAQRKKIEQIAKDLAEANEHLRELDKEKSEFVSIASHQLRTPLTAISGYASMLLEGSYGKLSKKTEEAVNRIFQSSGRLVLIIEDFLDITKIEQGRMTYQFTTVDMKGLLRGLIEELEPRAREKNMKLVLKINGQGSFNATADFGKIRQVMSNLIDNAIKYSGVGHIDIALLKDSARGRIRVSVHDTGIGISPQTMEKLFQKFSRAEGVKKIYTEGSGLGLYVAQEMVKAHHGRIWAESEGEGKGSTFHVELLAED